MKNSPRFIKYGKVYASKDGLNVRFSVRYRSFAWFMVRFKVWLECVTQQWFSPFFWFSVTPRYWLQYFVELIQSDRTDEP